MPISKYFKGHGREVMKEMKERYGEKTGESAFYATANKKHMTYKDPQHSHPFSIDPFSKGKCLICGMKKGDHHIK